MSKLGCCLIVIVLCLGMPAWLAAQDPAEKIKLLDADDEILGVGPTVTLQNGACSVVVNSFGRSTNYNVGAPCGNVLFETRDFITTNNTPVRPIGGPAFNMILAPIAFDIPGDTTSASSEVTDGNVVLDFSHTLGPAPGCRWETVVVVSANDPDKVFCYYAYTDYDVIQFPNNAGMWDGVSRFEVRACPPLAPCRVSFEAKVLADHWDQRPFPQLINAIGAFQRCQNLNDMPAQLGNCPPNVDWTGALQWGDTDNKISVSDPDRTIIVYSRERKGP